MMEPSPTAADLIAKLREEHALLDEQIRRLDDAPSLSPNDQMRRKRLAKMKLLAKDRIVALEAGH